MYTSIDIVYLDLWMIRMLAHRSGRKNEFAMIMGPSDAKVLLNLNNTCECMLILSLSFPVVLYPMIMMTSNFKEGSFNSSRCRLLIMNENLVQVRIRLAIVITTGSCRSCRNRVADNGKEQRYYKIIP